MKRLLLAALLFAGPAYAADSTLAVTPGSGTTIVVSPDGSGNVVPHSIICDHTTPTQCIAIDSSGRITLVPGFATSANQITGSQYGNQANWVSGHGSGTNTAAHTIITAPGSNKLYVTGVQCGRNDAGTTAITLTFNDGAGTTMVLPNSGGGGGNNYVLPTPLIVAATTAFTFTSDTGTTTVTCNAQGYNAP